MKNRMNRRDFMCHMAKGSAALATLHPLAKPVFAASRDRLNPRVRVPNPYVNALGHPLLISVQGTDFAGMLAAGLSALGGLNRLISNNQPVLIKPNLVINNESYPTISSPESVVAMIQAIQQISTGTIKVGDAGSITTPNYYREVGLYPAVPDAGGQLVTFSSTYNVRRSTWAPSIPDFQVYSEVYDAPLILDFCNLKRHYAARMTCALKNHVGTVNGPDSGPTRDWLHTNSQGPPAIEGYLPTVAEIAGLVNSELAIVDARQIMTVNGPYQAWGGVVTPLNRLILCGDLVATDAYCSQLMAAADTTYNPLLFQGTLMRAVELGLGTANLSEVEIHELILDSADRDTPSQIKEFQLRQNHPNPFNQSTVISYELRESGPVNLKVFDGAGRLIRTFAQAWQAGGQHQVTFDAAGLASGNYFCSLETGKRASSYIKMTLLK
jgi:uncharacterized protein (DUF362 family)